jgi:hypothetical protein
LAIGFSLVGTTGPLLAIGFSLVGTTGWWLATGLEFAAPRGGRRRLS